MSLGLLEGEDVLVELFLIPECPHAATARQLLRQALDDIGLAHVEIVETVLENESAAPRTFAGSPSFFFDGVDLFPAAAAGLACRLYATDESSGGTPPLRELRRALKAAAAFSTTVE